MDLAQLRAADVERVYRAAERIDRIVDGLKDSADRVTSTIHKPLADGAWSGAASGTALAHIGQVGKDIAGTVGVVGQVGQQVRRFADALASAKALVARADDIAGAAQLTIGADGSITFPTFGTPLTEAEVQSLKAAGEETNRLLGKALAMASDADAACAGALAANVGAAAGSAVGSVGGAAGTSAGAAITDVGERAGAAARSAFTNVGDIAGAAAGSSLGSSDDRGFMEQLGALFDDPKTDFDDSVLGELIDNVSDGVWLDPDGGFDIGNMSPSEQIAFEETFQASADDLLGAGVVDTISEEASGPGPASGGTRAGRTWRTCRTGSVKAGTASPRTSATSPTTRSAR